MIDAPPNVYRDFVSSVLAATYIDGADRKSAEFEFLIDEIVIDGGNYRLTMYCASAAYYESMSASNSKAINDVSPICVLEYAGTKTIFTGDANSSQYSTSAEKRFMNALNSKGITGLDSDILKVAHHGGKDSSGADFLDFIDVEYAIISVGEKSGVNSSGDYQGFATAAYYQAGYTLSTRGNGAYDHPHRDIAGIPVNGEGRLAASGVNELYRSDLNGDVIFVITDSGAITVNTEKDTSVNGTTIVYVSVTIKGFGNVILVILYYDDRVRVF
ncbi:MAG: hypothetical protein EOM87_03595 [Clostridia bacterium]|nr:hypothetical protein [Clostridia bacterium]